MAIDLDGGDGLFDRLGKIQHVINITNTFLGGTSAGDLPEEVEDIFDEFPAGTDVYVLRTIDAVLPAFETYQSGALTFLGALKTAAQELLIKMVNDNNAIPVKDVATALAELKLYMEDNSEDVDASTVSVSSSAHGSNTGSGILVASSKDGEGKALENMYAEDMIVKITDTSSAATGGGGESVSIKGEAAAANILSHDWPLGSGTSTTSTVRNPAANGFLTNGDFNDFTTNAPDNWTIDTGAAGTDIYEETSTIFVEASCMKWTGDGSTLVKISQDLSAKSWVSRTNYMVSVWIKQSDASPAAGVLQIDLYDSDNAAIIADDAGTNNALAIDLTTGSTSWTHYPTSFRLPDPLPDSIHARVHFTTALTNTVDIFIADLIIGPALSSTYTGGPYLDVVRGQTPFAKDDFFTAIVANNYAGAFQQACWRLFDNPQILLPSDTGGTETIDDALIG